MFSPAAASAQGRGSPAVADSSPARIMAHVGNNAGAVWLLDILRQSEAQHPQAKLDEIADSLVARAIDPAAAQPTTSEAYRHAVDAINALMLAGISAPWNGRPYSGAFDRLVKVHRQAAAQGVRIRALAGMLVASHARGVDYLRQTAESSDSTAYDAAELLIVDANGGSSVAVTPTAAERQQSVSALKALASGGRVKDPRVATMLDVWIQRYRSEHPS